MANPTKADKAAAKTANASAANEARNAPAKEAGKFETVADFQRKYPGVNMAEFLEQVGIEHGLISRSQASRIGEPMSAGERAMAGHCEDADLSALNGLAPHLISRNEKTLDAIEDAALSALNGLAPHLISRNEKTLDGAFLEIDELRETVDFLKRELEALKHGR